MVGEWGGNVGVRRHGAYDVDVAGDARGLVFDRCRGKKKGESDENGTGCEQRTPHAW